MNKRFVTRVLVIVLSLTACTPVAPAAATAGGATGGEINLLAWNISPELDKALQDQTAKFAETHPGSKVNVTLVPYDQFNTKLTLMLTSGAPPDLSAMPSDIMAYAKEEKV